MIAEQKPFRAHAFEDACATNDVDHRLTKPKHPWTNGQVERMNCTIKDATVKRYFYESHEQLRTHLRDFVDAYNFARRLKTLKGLTPYEFVCKAWTSQPQRFKLNPLQQMPGMKQPRFAVLVGVQMYDLNGDLARQTRHGRRVVAGFVQEPDRG